MKSRTPSPSRSPHTPRLTFGKQERLGSRRIMDAIFSDGRVVTGAGFRLHWLAIEEGAAPIQVAFSVSKRNLKKAVHRNRMRRLMREAYRKNKHTVHNSLEAAGMRVAMVLIFTGREVISAREAEDKIILILQRFRVNACGKG